MHSAVRSVVGACILAASPFGNGCFAETKAFTWGSSQFGQLGLGDDRDRDTPTHVKGLDHAEVQTCSLSGETSACISRSGDVYTFGRGQDGALGHQGESNEAFPCAVDGPWKSPIRKVSSSPYHMMALSEEGFVYSWGRHWAGQLGRQVQRNASQPERISSLENIVDIACGRSHSLVLAKSGLVYSFGNGSDAALGHGDRQDRSTPQSISYLSDKGITSVAAGFGFSLFLSKDGSVYACGNGDYGKLGLGTTGRYQKVPRRIDALRGCKVTSIAAGELHAAALTEDGRVYTWGMGKDGQTGHSDTSNMIVPRLVEDLKGIEIKSISCGGGHTCAIAKDGTIYIWGRGRNGQLGRGNHLESIAAYRTNPVTIDFFKGMNVSMIELGADHSIAVVQE